MNVNGIEGPVTGRGIEVGALVGDFGLIAVDNFNDALVERIQAVAINRPLELIDAGITIARDAALTAITGTFTLGIPGTTNKFLSFTVANGTVVGKVLSVFNKGLTWQATGDTKSERIIPVGQRAVWSYTGGSASAGRAYLWAVWRPQEGAYIKRDYTLTP